MPLQKWWENIKENCHPEELINFLQHNREKLEESFRDLDRKHRLYNSLNRVFSIFFYLAKMADQISEKIQFFLMRFPFLRKRIAAARDWKNQLNFRELVEFSRAKLFSLRMPPYNEKTIRFLEEIMEYASRHGLDMNQFFPKARQRILEKKHHLLQHKFFQEFSRNRMEQLLAIQFEFERSLFPVLPDSAFWHKVFEYLERKMVVDIILVNRDNHRFSWKHTDPRELETTDVIQILRQVVEIKNKGHRVFFVGHHEGYLGPYFVRSVIRKLGFDNLTRNCNTIVGPRMFSNLVLRNGAANVGNLFVTVPSQKTTAIQTKGLAEALKETARRTQCLISFPDAGLYLMKKLDLPDFKKTIRDTALFEQQTHFLEPSQKEELKAYIHDNQIAEVMQNLKNEDYSLFRKVMRECFVIFPEGKRSDIASDGSVLMNKVNPKYMKTYMRPGDYVVPVNLVGGSDIGKGWRLRPAKLGISLDMPFEVTVEMLHEYATEGLNIMRKIAALPNIKAVRLHEENGPDAKDESG
ncbi:MAG: hypothetical protein C4522_03870 [Desulfobacteraceae bacterium]|nr:MAG: hypothetical protein C4522_03870 [Desulfobacteraceae bacterium]